MIDEFRSVFKKIAKFEIKTVLTTWGRLPIHKLNFNCTKYNFVDQFLELALVSKLHYVKF